MVRISANAKDVVPPVVYLLADHLDAVLARGEDLLAIDWSPDRIARCAESIADTHRCQRQAVDDIRTFEMALVSRALKAQDRARELAAKDHRFRPMARLFAAGTVALADAAREAGDQTEQDFQCGDGTVAYLRNRGLLSAEASTLDDCGAIRVSAKFLVMRRIELGPLLDLVAMFLDTLELHYELYAELTEPALPEPAASMPTSPIEPFAGDPQASTETGVGSRPSTETADVDAQDAGPIASVSASAAVPETATDVESLDTANVPSDVTGHVRVSTPS